VLDQPCSNGILQQVNHLRIKILRSSQHVIERFRLPHSPFAAEYSVYLVSRDTFNGIHDFGQRINLHGGVVD